MAINFASEKSKLKDTLLGNAEKDDVSTSTVAKQIASWYDKAIRQSGQDALYGNSVLQANKPALQSALQSALQTASKNKTPSAYQQIAVALQTGIIAYWTGATLELTVPPPPSVQVVSNVVANPGTFQTTIPPVSDNLDQFIQISLIVPIQAHLLTVSGITTSLTPQPTGPPVPVPYPFQGYI